MGEEGDYTLLAGARRRVNLSALGRASILDDAWTMPGSWKWYLQVIGIGAAAWLNLIGHAMQRLMGRMPISPGTLTDAEVFWVAWGTLSLERHRGQGPLSLAHLSAKAAAEAERSLGDEAGGPVGQLLTTPEGEEVADDGDDTTPADPYADLRADIGKARGAALLLETTSGGHGERGNAPARDWVASRLGPNPPAALVQAAADGYERMLSACGCPPSLFMGNADGTSQREGLRRWHQSTVLPVAKLLTHELSARLESPVALNFDNYALDMVSRAQTVAKLVSAGVDLSTG